MFAAEVTVQRKTPETIVNPVATWTSDDVEKWLKDNGLHNCCEKYTFAAVTARYDSQLV